ncbi:surfeit locus protein 1 isoform X2 [Cornus florida]|uniref:surfeit locus protein 1 isoform X2 n=1 Tax=Cornus florida TaxID=4283 RepID=UPI00289A8D01|nr:surfeit locus protein 1 isoform X2 [Cornus florida]
MVKMATASISKTLTTRLRGNGSLKLKLFPSPSSSFSTSASPAISSAPQPPPTSSTQPKDTHGGSRWSKLFLFVPGALTFGLGTWQIFRRQEKIKMLEYRQNRLGMEPIIYNNIVHSSEKLDSLEFRRVMCKGVFDEKKSIYIGPRSRSISGVTENGYYVITPLVPIHNNPESAQSPILVNRGWVPRSWREKLSEVPQDDEQSLNTASTSVQDNERSSWWRFWSKKPKIIEVQAPAITPVEVVGVVRGSEKPSIFVPANDPSSCQWFYVDVPAIARTCGLPENTIYIEAINENVNPSNPYPIPKDTNTLIRSSVMPQDHLNYTLTCSVMPQDHLNYTLTWYSLSAAVTFMAFKRLSPKKNRR